MKKIFGVLLSVVLICSLSIFIASAENVDGAVEISSITARPGEKVEVFVSVDCSDGIKTLSLLDFYYDNTALSLVKNECCWLIDGKLKDIDFDNNASIITFDGNTILSGNVLKLVFLLSENVQSDNVSVTCDVVATRMIDNREEKISISVVSGVISVNRQCEHIGGEATCKDKAICSVCGETYGILNANNHKNIVALKAEAATCGKAGKTEGKKCTDCGVEIVKRQTVPATGKHTYSNSCDSICNVCSAKRSIKHTYTNACDKECNVCKTTRSITHSYKVTTTKATLSKNGKVVNKCSVCGYVSKTTTVYYPKTIKLSATTYTYSGKAKTPTVTVKDSKGNTLKKDTDYTVTYASGRKNTGKYSVTVTFKGKYSGKKVLYFNILPSKTSKITPTCNTTSIKASWSKVTGASGYKVELLNSKGKVVKTATTTKTSYTFKKLSKVTTYKVRVTAYKTIDSKKVYSTSSTTITTSTAPAKVTLSKVSAGLKSATPTWKKVSGASGYEVQYSTSSKFKSAKTATVKKGSNIKTTIKKLTKGKKYYFKVRAYKTVSGKKVYSAWSAVKSVKVK